MQDVQNIPPPDVNSTERDDDFGSHSEINPDWNNQDIEKPNESVPIPSDRQPTVPIEEPPNVENEEEPKLIV